MFGVTSQEKIRRNSLVAVQKFLSAKNLRGRRKIFVAKNPTTAVTKNFYEFIAQRLKIFVAKKNPVTAVTKNFYEFIAQRSKIFVAKKSRNRSHGKFFYV